MALRYFNHRGVNAVEVILDKLGEMDEKRKSASLQQKEKEKLSR
jgi:hypothetical protein